MFHFVCKQVLISRRTISNVRFLQTPSFKSKPESANEKYEHFTVPYLVNSFNYSFESAIRVSKNIKITSIEEANNVVQFLTTYGFSDAQINCSVTRYPSLLLAKLDETLKPKFDYFISLGMSVSELAKMVTKRPGLLSRDLDTQIIPTCDFVKKILHNDSKLVVVLKKLPNILQLNYIEEVMKPNILVLQTHGVPEPNISNFFMCEPAAFIITSDLLEVKILKIKELGFHPKGTGFTSALRVVIQMSETNWEQKKEVYKRLGWSEEEFLSALRRQPHVMMISEMKIEKHLDFFVKRMGWSSSVVSKYPKLMMTSLENSIIPRCSVLHILFSRGVLNKKDVNIPSLLTWTRKDFQDKYVINYQDEIPEVVVAYQGKIEYHGFDIHSNE